MFICTHWESPATSTCNHTTSTNLKPCIKQKKTTQLILFCHRNRIRFYKKRNHKKTKGKPEILRRCTRAKKKQRISFFVSTKNRHQVVLKKSSLQQKQIAFHYKIYISSRGGKKNEKKKTQRNKPNEEKGDIYMYIYIYKTWYYNKVKKSTPFLHNGECARVCVWWSLAWFWGRGESELHYRRLVALTW